MKKIICFLVLLMSVFFLQAQNVAKIGANTYPSLQAALDDAHNMTGDVTIELLKNIEGYSIVHQKADLNLTIEGNNDTIAGQIIVDGDGRAAGTEKLTIRNVTFCDDGSHFYTGTDAFVLVPSTKESGKPWYTNKYNYAHNITVSDCEFTSTSSSLNVVGFKANSGAGNYNTALNNVTGDNLHSLAQFTGTTGATITNCKVPNGDSFINVSGGAGDYVITDCKFVSSVTDGYGIRDKDGSSANFTIERDTINASKALVFGKKASESPAPSGQMNVASGVYDGTVEIIPTASTATFSFTGGTFSEPKATVDGYCVPGYAAVANDPDAQHCTVRKIEVAKIGTTTYPSLQAAVDDAYSMTGAVTIELLKNTTENVIVCQQKGLELTIDGKDSTLTGQIIVNGINVTTTGGGDISASSLNINNLNFEYSASMLTSYFVDVPSNPTTATWHSCNPSYTGKYNDAHNVTVSNCTFDGGGSSNGVAAVHVASNTNNVRNITVDNCTVANAHSLLQIQGGTNGVTVTNCKGTSDVHNGINITGGSSNFVIANDTLTVDGYGIRIRNVSTHAATCTMSDNLINAPAEGLVFSGNTNAGDTIYITSGTYIGPIADSDNPTNLYLTGGTYTEPYTYVQNFCAPNYIAYDADPESGYCTVRKNRPVMRMDSTDVICFGENNGTDTVRIQGGVAPFQLVLSSSVLDKNDTVNITDRLHIYTNLKPGSYLVELTDAEGETATGTFTIKQPDSELEITALNVPVRPCPLMGSGNYTVSVEAQGGNTGPYSYIWGDAATDVNSDATTVVSGTDDRDSTYTVSVTVKDSKNCPATATETFTVSAVIANDGTIHSNSKLTIDTIRQGIYTDCDTIIRDYGTPVFTTTIPEGYPEDRLIIVNDIATSHPDSVFYLGENKIIWTATDTCGHSITGEQVVIIFHYPCPDVTVEGKTYSSVRIGCDCWMSENLQVTKYSDGRDINNVMTYVSETQPDATENANRYGYLYDWNAAMDAENGVNVDANGNVQGVCPTGWHLPTPEAFMNIAGSNTSTNMSDLRYNDYWLDGGGNNSTGFSLLPGGYYNDNTLRYENILGNAYLWSVNTTNVNEPKVFWADCHCYMWQVNDATTNTGCSVRCIKD